MKNCRALLSSNRVLTNLRNGVEGPSVTPVYSLQSVAKPGPVRHVHILRSEARYKSNKIGIQGAEMFLGQRKRGVELGPKVIRETGLVEALRNMGHDVLDYGNIPVMELQEAECLQVANNIGTGVVRISQTTSKGPDGAAEGTVIRNTKQVADASKLVSEWTSKILRDGRICVTLGGDHALGIGTVHGASQVHSDLAVIWVDAHSDINTPLTSDSGNIHGMSVAFVVKELQPYVTQLPAFASWIQPKISASNIAYIGLRDVDPAEATILEMLGIVAYSMRDVDRYGISRVTEMALGKISQNNPNRPIHLSYDIDSLCESIIKSTGTPVLGGLTLREGISLVEMIHDTGRLVSMDLVEVNPLLGSERDVTCTAQAAKHIILGALGQVRGGRALNSIPKP